MIFGMSTACFFPNIYTEQAILQMGKMNVENIEIFFSCFSEYKKPFVKDLKKRIADNGMNTYSIHPLSLQFEPQLFSRHKRAKQDSLDIYKQVLEAERKAIYSDINLLRELGYDIVKTNDGGAAYFLGERAMEIAEAEICASAVSAAKFITQKKSIQLINKLGNMFSNAQSAIFRNRLELARTLKTRNEEIFYNIDKIVNAQNIRKKISFLYFEYMPDKTHQFRREGKRYFASPYSLMWFEDAYYLVCNIDKYDNLSHFRVDRMAKIQVLDDDIRNINEVSEYKNYIDFDEYHRSVFSMFGGDLKNIRIRFREELATAVFDRFGLDVPVTEIKNGWFTISVSVRVSPGFISWLTIFKDKAEVLSPDSLRNDISLLVESLSRIYKKST